MYCGITQADHAFIVVKPLDMGVQQLHFILKVSKKKVKVIRDIPKKR